MLELNRFAIQQKNNTRPSLPTYDIRNADTGELVGTATETPRTWTQALGWIVSKRLLPIHIEVCEKPDDSLVFTLCRSGCIVRSRVEIRDAQGELVGYFNSPRFRIDHGFDVYDQNGNHFAHVQGHLFGYNYRFLTGNDEVELGRVFKRIGGLPKTGQANVVSADTSFLEITPILEEEPLAKMLILAAALAVDLIDKAESGSSGE